MSELIGIIGSTSISISQGDITKEELDAIVNAANSSLLGGGGVDGAIHRAGGPQILEECRAIRARQGSLAAGKAVTTSGGKLKAKWVIHTVGPVWRGGNSNEAETLSNCYTNSLMQAAECGAKSVAFPSISTGAYGYPVEEASYVAASAVAQFVRNNSSAIDEVRFVLFDNASFNFYKSAVEKALAQDS